MVRALYEHLNISFENVLEEKTENWILWRAWPTEICGFPLRKVDINLNSPHCPISSQGTKKQLGVWVCSLPKSSENKETREQWDLLQVPQLGNSSLLHLSQQSLGVENTSPSKPGRWPPFKMGPNNICEPTAKKGNTLKFSLLEWGNYMHPGCGELYERLGGKTQQY